MKARWNGNELTTERRYKSLGRCAAPLPANPFSFVGVGWCMCQPRREQGSGTPSHLGLITCTARSCAKGEEQERRGTEKGGEGEGATTISQKPENERHNMYKNSIRKESLFKFPFVYWPFSYFDMCLSAFHLPLWHTTCLRNTNCIPGFTASTYIRLSIAQSELKVEEDVSGWRKMSREGWRRG